MRFVGIRLMTTRASRPTPAIFVLEVPPRSRTGRRESWRTRMTLSDIEGHSPNASIPSLACCNCAVKTYIILSECQIPCCSAPWTGCRMLFAFMHLSESLRRLAIQRLITTVYRSDLRFCVAAEAVCLPIGGGKSVYTRIIGLGTSRLSWLPR